MPSKLQEWLDLHHDTIKIGSLDLFHTANGEEFVKILMERKLRANLCLVYNGENILYFFLGRPAYKVPVSRDPGYWQLPAVFVTRGDLIESAHRVLPFDSGALHDDRYRNIIGNIGLENFEISPNAVNIGKLILKLFGDVGLYKLGQARGYNDIRTEIGANTSQFVPAALSKLYNCQLENAFDDRSRVLEIQFQEDIEINIGNLKAIIICNEWLRDPVIRKALDDLGVDVIGYPILPLSTESYYSEIYRAAGIDDAE